MIKISLSIFCFKNITKEKLSWLNIYFSCCFFYINFTFQVILWAFQESLHPNFYTGYNGCTFLYIHYKFCMFHSKGRYLVGSSPQSHMKILLSIWVHNVMESDCNFMNQGPWVHGREMNRRACANIIYNTAPLMF